MNNGQFNGAALIQSNYNNPGNFEVVAVTREGQLHHYWRNPDFTWSRTLTPIASGVNIAIPHVNIHVYMAPGANRISNTPGVTDRVQEQIDVANAIWSREAGIRVNLIGITKIVTMPPAESIAFKSKDIPCGIAEFVDNFPNPIRGRVSRLLGFRDLTRSTLPVYFIGGDDIQPNPQVTGCILITRHPDVGIVLSNGALNRILAHEIGHALFFDPTNLTGARPVLPDPSADPTGDPNHSTVANNLMRDTVPSNFTIILVESQMNRALRSNFVIRC